MRRNTLALTESSFLLQHPPAYTNRIGPEAGMQPRRVDREFGVPFAGEILDPAKWTQTALKTLPGRGRLDWRELFGRDGAASSLDLGLRQRPLPDRQRRLAARTTTTSASTCCRSSSATPRKRGNQRGLTNVRFAVVGATRVPGAATSRRTRSPRSTATTRSRTTTRPRSTAGSSRRPSWRWSTAALVPGGLFVIQTDNPGYWKYIREVVPMFFDFHERIGRWPDAPRGRTRREIIALQKGLPVFRGTGTARTDLTEEKLGPAGRGAAAADLRRRPPPAPTGRGGVTGCD